MRSALAAALARAGRKASPSSAKSLSVPAPMGSINTVDAGGALPAGDCILRFNMIPAEYGLRVRLGSKEWVTGLTGGAVRCVMPFAASTAASNKVFATTSTGIWDVTASSDAPSPVLAFGTTSTTSGYGAFAAMVTAAGHFLMYADEVNGAYLYTESTGTWAAASFTGVSAANIVHVCAYKNRLYLTERDSGKLWYLATNAISGTATSLNVGARFASGGYLVGAYSWTYDGGSGMDDSLVVISSGGSVLVYQGIDPSTSGLWQLRGVYEVGAMPVGRRIASDMGGDLLVMTRAGLLSMRQLTVGNSAQYVTSKIANLWNKWMLTRADTRGWQMVQSPEDSTLIIIAPNGEAVASDQLVMSLNARVWSQYRDLGMGNCAASYAGKVWYGTADGKIRIMDGYTDGRTLADPTTTADITYSLLTAFSNLGTAQQKRLHLARPTFISTTSAPSYTIQARFRWDMSEADAPTTAAPSGASDWDTAVWDVSLWGEDYSPAQSVRGLSGCGPEVAVAIKGVSATRTILTGFDLVYDVGGIL